MVIRFILTTFHRRRETDDTLRSSAESREADVGRFHVVSVSPFMNEHQPNP